VIELTDSNFALFAAKHYDNPQCVDTQEFLDDLKRFAYLKRAFSKYHENNDVNIRLILNHIITLTNLFGIHTTSMLFFRVDKEHHKYLKPFLVFLEYLPNTVNGIKTSEIPMDETIVRELRNI